MTGALLPARAVAFELAIPLSRIYSLRAANLLEPVHSVRSRGRTGTTAIYDIDQVLALANVATYRCSRCRGTVARGRRICSTCRDLTRQNRTHRPSRPRPDRRQSFDEPRVLGRRGTTLERFMAKVELGWDCWAWRGSLDDRGHGLFWDGTRVVRAHRWAFENLGHPSPRPLTPGEHVRQRCGAPSCVSPLHLEVKGRSRR